MQTFFVSVKNFIASQPPSRPTPECFIPPKGVRKSRSNQQFTQTMPLLSCAATRWARFKFSVHNVADNPYAVLFAYCITSSSESKGMIVTTGPKISSWFVRQSKGNPVITVGATKYPCSHRPLTVTLFPPVRIVPPSCFGFWKNDYLVSLRIFCLE